ncbi:MAG: hypothetical protein ACM3KD_04820 [Hyphomicrobiaceae bacterium]
MESPPLQIDAAYAATGPASIVHYLPRYTLGMARTVGVLSGVVVLLELSSASHRQAAYPPPVQPTETWLPSVELSREAARLLSAAGKAPDLSPRIQPIPGGEERGRTLLMENWMAPIRSWYNNDEAPSTRYAELKARHVDAVVEIGISNYEIHAGKLLLQVHMKLIDPGSGRLLARARASSSTPIPPMDEVFADDAKGFKASVSRAGNTLVMNCLQEIGLVPKESVRQSGGKTVVVQTTKLRTPP